MIKILGNVPGDSIAARARACRISRQTYYSWLKESFRPSLEQALRLAELTGYGINEIMGR